MPIKLSPFAPKDVKKFFKLDGIKVSIAHCGLKKNKKEDLVLIKFDQPSLIYGAFTLSKTPGEPIIWNKSIIDYEKVSAILINSGNANVFNGEAGRNSLRKIVKRLSDDLCVSQNEIYIASTGVIGELLDHNKIIRKIPYLIKNLKNDHSTWFGAANAIRTTDTYAKTHSEKSKSNRQIVINGLAKGSGMISPNMATMLGFIFTNAQFSGLAYKKKFFELINKTFNCISVDGDTSTSDMVLLISVKNEDKHLKIDNSKKQKDFFKILETLMMKLSQYIVKDGEGASKFIMISVKGAKDDLEAKKIAMSIGNSPLFKTAMAGSDSNWGRIIMAIGKTYAKIEPQRISLRFGNFLILKNGKSFFKKNFSSINRYLKKSEIEINVELGIAEGSAKIWTCDFTKEYISINSDYRS